MRGAEKIWFSVLLLLLCGCRTVRDSHESTDIRIRTNVVERLLKDSVFVHDSIYVHERSDTVFFTKYRTLYKEKLVRDTIYVCDTLYKERIVTEYVSREATCSRWWWLLLFLLLLFCPGVPQLFLKIFNKCIRFFHLKV